MSSQRSLARERVCGNVDGKSSLEGIQCRKPHSLQIFWSLSGRASESGRHEEPESWEDNSATKIIIPIQQTNNDRMEVPWIISLVFWVDDAVSLNTIQVVVSSYLNHRLRSLFILSPFPSTSHSPSHPCLFDPYLVQLPESYMEIPQYRPTSNSEGRTPRSLLGCNPR